MLCHIKIKNLVVGIGITAAALVLAPDLVAKISVKSNCDANGDITIQGKMTDAEQCADACDRNTACDGFSFISNWNRCFQKVKVTRLASVKMFSGQIAAAEGKRAVVREGENLDHKGKDWQKQILKTGAACRDQCLAKAECQGFTFIGGYDVCWLKNTAGALVDKTFYCGAKKDLL